MAKKSTKSRSGRQTLRHKHKVIRKVKEVSRRGHTPLAGCSPGCLLSSGLPAQHHRKKAKEERKNAKLGKKPRQPKDPGIPSDWPFKEQLIKEFEFKKQQILAREQAKKDAKKQARVRASRPQCTGSKPRRCRSPAELAPLCCKL